MKTAPWIVIAVLCLVIVIQNECHRCPIADPCQEPDTIQIVKVVNGDSVPHELPVVPAPDPDSIKTQPVPAGIDSAAVAFAYYSKVFGYIKMVDDSSMYVGFKYLVEQNRLKWVIPNVANRKPTAYYYNTTYVYKNPPRLKLFAGFGISIQETISGINNPNLSLHGSLAILTKKDHLYQLTVDPFRNYYSVDAHWYIRFKKLNKN